MKTTSLDGRWQILPVGEFRERYPEDGWLETEVPGHWQQLDQLQSYSGKVVYRKDFSFRRARGRRYRLRLNGVFYRSTVYLNDRRLGEHEGYFSPQEYEVTGILQGKNTLLVEVDCPDEEDLDEKTMITGVFSHWDALDPETNPGGIWLPVEIVATGEVRIQRTLMRVENLGRDSAARLGCRVHLDAQVATSAELRVSLSPYNFEGDEQVYTRDASLSAGPNKVEMFLDVEDPKLWWTHDQGFPSLYHVTVEVSTSGERSPSDKVEFNYGLRTFEMRDWIAYLNGRRMFIRGNNYGPGDTRLATMTRERIQRDLELAKGANMNMLRLHAHVEHPAFYEVADELGLLVWQDFPLQWQYAKEVLPEALRQVEQMVHHLFNHPSIVVWCTHNEPGIRPEPPNGRPLWVAKTLLALLFYNWNRDRMDTRLKGRVEELDGTRFVVRSSGEWRVPVLRKGTDSHIYYGWYRRPDPAAKLEGLGKRLNFVTEFGAQSFPDYESSTRFMAKELSQVDWGQLERRHSFQRGIMDQWLNLGSFTDLHDLIEASQDHQISVNRAYIDRLRFQKYRPTGGVLAFSFHDPNPAVQWSVIDYWRVPKRSYYHMQRAFHPQYVFTLMNRSAYAVGEEIGVPIYVVNDSPEAYDEVDVSAHVVDEDGNTTTQASFSRALAADSQAELAHLLHFRFNRPGQRTLRLSLTYGDEVFENEYPLLITAD
jgi:beta-mannosidase